MSFFVHGEAQSGPLRHLSVKALCYVKCYKTNHIKYNKCCGLVQVRK